MRVWLALLSASLQAQMSYRSSYLLEMFGRGFVTSLELAAVFVLFGHIGDLAGWTRWEVVYLYGVASVALGLAELLTDGLNDMPELIRRGTFDGILIRPAPALVQVLGRQCRPMHAGRVIQGALALAASMIVLDRPLGPIEAFMFFMNISSSMVVYG